MRAVIQRTILPATVTVNNMITGEIKRGLIVYLGIEDADTDEDVQWLSRKIINLRIFSDNNGKMNYALKDIDDSGLLVISQFTLFASTKKGNRPSYLRSGKPNYAKDMYNRFVSHTKMTHNIPVETGIFAADMKVSYTNDGPVTIIIDTKNKE